VAATRSRRDERDARFGLGILALRKTVADLDRWIGADRRWDSRFVRAPLVRETVAVALDAEPGALYALAAHVAADLRDAGPRRLPTPVRACQRVIDSLQRH